MNVTIKPGAATDDARQIDRIVESMSENLDTLNKTIIEYIPGTADDGVNTDWSNTVKNNWKGYYSNDIPDAMLNMKASATNLRNAVDAVLKYSNDQ